MTAPPIERATRRADAQPKLDRGADAIEAPTRSARRYDQRADFAYFFFSMCLVCLRTRGEYFMSSSLLVPGFFMMV